MHELRGITYQDFVDAKQVVGATGEAARSYQRMVDWRDSQRQATATLPNNTNRPVNININYMPIIPNNNGQ